MSVFKTDAYGLECDRCHLYLCGRDSFYLWVDEAAINEARQQNDWIEREGKHYCPGCYTIEEEADKVIVKE